MHRQAKIIAVIAFIGLVIGLPTIASATTFFINQSTFPNAQGIDTSDPWFAQNITTPNWANTTLFNLDAVALRGRISGLSSTTMTITVSNNSYTFPNQTGTVGSDVNTYYEITISKGNVLLIPNSTYNLTFTPNAPAGTTWIQNLNSLGDPYSGGRAFDAANTMGASSDLTFNVSLSQHDTVGNWHFNEGTGNFANDSSGFNNNGTVVNTTWATALNNGSVNQSALSFGVADKAYVNFSANSSINLTGALTISAWVKDASSGSNQAIIANYNSAGTASDYYLFLTSSNNLQYQYSNAGTESWTSSATPDINKWHHVAVTDDGNHNVVLYIDGVVVSSTHVGSVTKPSVGMGNLSVGRPGDFDGQYFNGTIDEVKLFNYALTQSEITTEFQRFQAVPAYPVANTILPAAFPPLQTTVNFTWYNTVSGFDATEIQVAQDINFNIIVHDGFHNTQYANVQLNSGQTYYWRLKQFNSTTSTYGNTSETQTFTIASASSVTGSGSSIQGIVYEIINGAQIPVSGTQVYLTNSTTSFEFTTSSNGYFLFQNLAANSTYSIHGENAPIYNPTGVFPVTTGNGTTVTQNLLITRFFSPFVPNYVYEKFIVRNLFDTKFPGVTVNVFVDGDVTPTFTKTTDTMGQATFQLIKDQLYRVTFSGGGLSSTITVNVYGKEEEYPINVLGGVPSTNVSSNNIVVVLDHSAFNATFENLTLTYNDTSLTTTSLTFFVINSTNGNNTVMFNTTLASTNLASLNFTVPNTCTCSYIYGYFTSGGFPTNEAKTINFGGTIKTTLSSDVQNWIAIILLVILASMFSARNVKIGAILLPLMAFVLAGFGWLIVNPLYPAIVLILGVLVYMRKSEVKTQI